MTLLRGPGRLRDPSLRNHEEPRLGRSFSPRVTRYLNSSDSHATHARLLAEKLKMSRDTGQRKGLCSWPDRPFSLRTHPATAIGGELAGVTRAASSPTWLVAEAGWQLGPSAGTPYMSPHEAWTPPHGRWVTGQHARGSQEELSCPLQPSLGRHTAELPLGCPTDTVTEPQAASWKPTSPRTFPLNPASSTLLTAANVTSTTSIATVGNSAPRHLQAPVDTTASESA
ncbi:PREDICTED: uncharacterized protein LOC109380500 [Hipposideros armiger]|uniref:Uncharacterized protein LOC109380500 n=1 Tax=Hipposideros armiger TaxID=186990 RepID=A0A8B7QY97_HIPAR|nr:PREDICTED: uncharacterized protein LOC109380500 [Hipposideros armiger]